MLTSFQRVSWMNTCFNNPQGDPANIDWGRVRKQSMNIGHEFCELMTALGADPVQVSRIKGILDEGFVFVQYPVLYKVRDALCDVHVFAYGSHHMMGIHADLDMDSVVKGVMTRFIKDEADKAATIAKHAAAGVTEVYFEGEYPTMVMKSAKDQPDAPKGKFLKSAIYREPVFYDTTDTLGGCSGGVWPAFWTFHVGSEDRPEIDIMEAYCGKKGEEPK